MEPLEARPSHEPTYWKSLREIDDTGAVSELKANEFMAGVTDDFSLESMPGMSRKQFLALLTASAAFAAAGCSNYRDKGQIVPYNKQIEGVTPGIAQHYASTCTGCPAACGILVKTREGRPIKLDGNPDHPTNRGKICAKGQASILDFYDPSRLRAPLMKGAGSWADADRAVREGLAAAASAGKEIALVMHPSVSPTFRRVLEGFLRSFPTAKVYSYELFHDENRKKAWTRCYGSGEPPVIAWEKCDVILALESDFLGTEGHTVEQIAKFAERRSAADTKSFNRLYAVEGAMSQTGANADYRLRLRPDAQLDFVLSLLNEVLFVNMRADLDPEIRELVMPHSLGQFGAKHNLPSDVVRHLVSDLLEHAGRSIVYAGSSLPEGVHVAVNYLNEVLGNTELYGPAQAASPYPAATAPAEFEALVARMSSGAVGVVVHLNTNPVFHLPEALNYAEALGKVPLSVALVESENETSVQCTAALPIHHGLESWGDFEARTGVYSLRQPVVSPLYDTRQLEGVILSWSDQDRSYSETLYLEYLKANWQSTIFSSLRRRVDFAVFWNSALHDGVVLAQPERVQARRFALRAVTEIEAPAGTGEYVVALTESPFLGDGRFANNGWLQELPHPVSKVVWDNYAAVAPRTAKELGVDTGDMVEVSVGSKSRAIPVFVQAGQAERFLSVAMGYGRTHAGPVGSGVGTDLTSLQPVEALAGSRILAATVRKAAGHHEIVSTQEHHSLDDTFVKDFHKKREIIREGTVALYEKDPKFLQHGRHELQSITKEIEYKGVKWAMAIDLNKCVGCNACVSGCSVENNVPVVGKDQVKKGREMAWIRIDRYYSGTPEAPSMSHQPMLCQHCDNAPCEKVCPVVATTHSPDGLNQMTYNRCVGTKYCSNNCPYKVRRFNFFDYRDHVADGHYEQEPVGLMHNPEVTVRSRGVMEKCTFCVQRIAEARQVAVQQGREISGADVRTACQEACPASAIVFGDMNDDSSEVSRMRAHDLGYHVLEALNVRPNVTYIARLRNTLENNG